VSGASDHVEVIMDAVWSQDAVSPVDYLLAQQGM
jgi:hypothetical protein